MKKQLLAIAVSAASAAPMAAMADEHMNGSNGPEVYGRFDVTLQQTESADAVNGDTDSNQGLNNSFVNTQRFAGDDVGDQIEVRSNISRLGVKGSAGLDQGLSAIYQLEMEFDWVDGANTNFTNRNSFVGLHGESWGKFFVGRYDSIVKDAEFSVDQFNYTDADIDILFRNQNRYNNTINYESSKFGPGIYVKAQLIPGESRQNFDNDDQQTGIADGAGLSLNLQEGNMYGAIAYETGTETVGNIFSGTQIGNIGALSGPGQDLEVSTFRVSGGLDGEQFGVGFLYDSTETDGPSNGYDDAKTGYLLSGRFNPTTDLALKAQYGDSETRFHAGGDNDDRSITSGTLGADYMLGKQTKVYTFYSFNGVDGEDANGTEDESEFNAFAVGMQHKF